MSAATFILPKKAVSELENRDLAKAPKLSVSTVMNKTFMSDAEKYMADHIPLRSGFAKAKTQLELASGKREINGVFVTDEMLLENIQISDLKTTKGNIEALNSFSKKYENKIETSIMLVPTALEFYRMNAPALAKVADQTQYIKDVYNSLETINKADVFSSLASSASEYIFYRTDHHWTSLGAYYGYTSLAKTLGFKAASLDMFNIEHASHDFYGTLYSKVLCGEDLKDNIDLYHYTAGDAVTDVIRYTDKNTQTYPSIFFKENLEIKDKYTTFLGENTSIVQIKTKVENDKKIIIFKDSYAHSLMQFLPLHYKEILLVDLRYLTTPLEDYVNLQDYQQALFLYNVSSFTSNSIKQISLL